MDALKALVAKKRKATEEEFGGKKFVKRSEVEAARLQKLREEEQLELQEKEKKRRQQEEHLEKGRAAAAAKDAKLSKEDQELVREVLSPAEVVRRLRLLGQPATLFGEDDFLRMKRLRQAEQEMQLEDEHAGGGQQANTLLELRREAKASRARVAAAKKSKGRKGGAAGGEADGEVDGEAKPEEEAESETMAAFRRAAQLVKDTQAEERMCTEDRVHKYVARWMGEWDEDIAAMPEAFKATAAGNQTVAQWRQTSTFLSPMLVQLKGRSIKPELLAGLWGMVQHIKARDYLAAYDYYIQLAIGNAPWPIGVTSVGIHERSAREKISHVMNEQSTAHIMTDESTRRYLQGLKRLMTFVQRAYPTAPSKSVDFGAFKQPLGKIQAAQVEEMKQLEWKAQREAGRAGGGDDEGD